MAAPARRAPGSVVDVLDLAVADRLGAMAGLDVPPSVRAAVALAAAAPRDGHVCVDLADVAGPVRRRGDAEDAEPLLASLPAPGAWAAAVRGSGLARGPGDAGVTPLVVDGTRCYLDRYWDYEQRLLRAVVARSGDVAPRVAPDEVREVLDELLPSTGPDTKHEQAGPPTDRQRLAVASTLLRPLTVLSGGPGTGKTHTLVSALAAHVLLRARRGEAAPSVALVAPTGKAAARMQEAVRQALDERDLPEVVRPALQQVQGGTIHRLLRRRWDAPTRFRHDADDPLPHDLVVVDEASMVPLALMVRLVEAVHPGATLVLVGDRDQLVSVEAGAVLGDLCGPPAPPGGSSLRLSEGWTRVLADATGEAVGDDRAPMPRAGVWDGIVQLERFHRFAPDSGIGGLARAVRGARADATAAVQLLGPAVVAGGAASTSEVRRVAPTVHGGLPDAVRELVVDAAGGYLDAVDAGDGPAAIRLLDEVRLLCATRSGPLGVVEARRQVERWLAAAWPDRRLEVDGSYAGRPVLVTRNDHELGLMNGDVGVTLHRGDHPVVVFPDAATPAGVREVAAVRLPPHETVWAMTIHKSQGSQFRHAVVVLPEHDTRVLSRELVYTGITRARDHLTVVATEEVLRTAVARPVRRATGLADRLWPRQG